MRTVTKIAIMVIGLSFVRTDMKKLLLIAIASLFAYVTVFAETTPSSSTATDTAKSSSNETTQANSKEKSDQGGSFYDSVKSGWNKMIDALAPPGKN